MKRWMFNSLSALVLLLALWIRSYRLADRIDLLTRGLAYQQDRLWMTGILVERGGFGLSVSHSAHHYPDDSSWRLAMNTPTAKAFQYYSTKAVLYPTWISAGQSSGWRLLGFQWLRQVTTATGFWAIQRSIVVPFWVVALTTGVLPTLWLRRCISLGASRRSGAVPCPVCGYDLRATPERCPECGYVMQTNRITE